MFRYNRPQTSKDISEKIETRKFLTFYLNNDLYAVDALRVQEIASFTNITNLANTPDFVKGICNLRGTLIPVIDLRIIFNVPTGEYNEFTVMVIIHIENRMLAMVVDSVADVIDLAINELRPGKDYSVLNTRLVEALGIHNNKVIVVLDTEKLLSADMYLLLDRAVTQATNSEGNSP